MKKILIIRFSSIGDIVLTSPIIRCVKQQLKDVELHYLTKESHLPIVKHNPYIDKIYTIKKSVMSVMPQLKEEKYDFIIDLHNSIRSTSTVLHLVRPFNSVKKLNIKKELYVYTKINLLPKVHNVDRFFDVVEKLGVKNDGKGLDYFISDDEVVNLSDLPETHRNGYVAFVIGGKHATKRLPDNKIISICTRIHHPVIILGGKENHESGELIKSVVGDKVYNACGLYSLNQAASIIQQSKQVISNDTGLMHVAAAFKKPVISIWGNTVPAFGMYPYFPEEYKHLSKIIEVKNLHCRPCSKLGFEKCPKNHFKCMNLIDEKEVVNSIHWE
ncbi:MAG TPA: glycosyltransferase family 9 protein [Bacteroidales bacterium]|nr:glycosyltransferase family 9 protein [Bacteroidales bacterium]HPS17458.1 glycosyltransferase family 9 protein [Bacteroidales bacterium]